MDVKGRTQKTLSKLVFDIQFALDSVNTRESMDKDFTSGQETEAVWDTATIKEGLYSAKLK